jgi:hypothetical protein
MPGNFRSEAKGDLARLLSYWKTIEFWIKRAEQVNKKALIPAINELRYASRQIFQVVRLLENDMLSDGDKHIISKRLIIAEQYLLNADHDICDAVVGFYESNIEYLDNTYGVSSISMFYVGYPQIREHVKACGKLIADSRGEYNDRKRNYDELRKSHFPRLLSAHEQITDAEVHARAAKEEMERQVIIAKSQTRWMEYISIIGTIAGLIGLPLSVYLWQVGPKTFCVAYQGNAIADGLCAHAAKYEALSASFTNASPQASAHSSEKDTSHPKSNDDPAQRIVCERTNLPLDWCTRPPSSPRIVVDTLR